MARYYQFINNIYVTYLFILYGIYRMNKYNKFKLLTVIYVYTRGFKTQVHVYVLLNKYIFI